MQELS